MHRLEDIYMRGRHWPRTIRHEGHWSVRSYVVHLYYIVVHQPDAYIRQVHLYYRERGREGEGGTIWLVWFVWCVWFV